MKICYKCGCGNSDSSVICKECSASLTDVSVQKAEEIANEKEAWRERKEKNIKRIKLMLIPIYYFIFIPVAVLSIINETIMWLPMLLMAALPLYYYLCIFKADLLFELNYMFNLSVKNAEPTDHYYFTTQLSGYIILIFGIAFSIYIYCIGA